MWGDAPIRDVRGTLEADVMHADFAMRHGADVRSLLDRGAFARRSVTLPNGRSLPAEPFAEVMLDDLDYLARRMRSGGHVDEAPWQQLGDDLRRLRDLDVP